MKGVTVTAPKGSLVLSERPQPTLRPGYMLVRPLAVALNPADVLCVDWGICVPGALMGCDYAGEIVEVSTEGGSTRGWKPGDRVCGCTRPADAGQFENGTFAETICVKADLQLRIPDGMGWEGAACLGVVVGTVGRTFYDPFKLPYPSISDDGVVDTEQQPKRQILVYGGSSAMGTMYIQFAKLSNFYVLTTCSPHNFSLVKSYGADFVVDYHSPTAATDLQSHAKANAATMGPLTMCLDSISTADTATFCSKVLKPEPDQGDQTKTGNDASEKKYSAILPISEPAPGITTFITTGYAFMGEPWELLGQSYPASQEDFESAKKFAVVAEKLLKYGKVRPHPVDVRGGGLEGLVKDGLDNVRSGVSGVKAVYPL